MYKALRPAVPCSVLNVNYKIRKIHRTNCRITYSFFFTQCLAFVYIFLILMCYFFTKIKNLLQLTFEKRKLVVQKREKTRPEEKLEPCPPPPGYQMVPPLGGIIIGELDLKLNITSGTQISSFYERFVIKCSMTTIVSLSDFLFV